MNNDILYIAIKHKIYEWCIDIIFKNIRRNFPRKTYRIPNIGEHYVSISFDSLNETYYNCIVIKPSTMDDYDLLDSIDKKQLAFAIEYKKLVYGTESGEINITDAGDTDNYQYFTLSDLRYLKFIQ